MKTTAVCTVHCVSENVPPLTFYNLDTSGSITIIFNIHVTEKVDNENGLIFPPHLTSASALPEETGNPEIASFHSFNCCTFLPKTRNTLKYNLVTAKPPFIVKMIDWVH